MQRIYRYTTRRILVISALACAAMLLHAGPTSAADHPQSPVREVQARNLPVPTSVSPEMQKAIAAPAAFNPAVVPQTIEQWRATQKFIDSMASQRAESLARELNV